MPDPSWNLTDQDCDAFDLNWFKFEASASTCDLDTYDGRTVYKFTCPADGSGNYAGAVNTSLSAWTAGSFEIVFRTCSHHLGGYPKMNLYLRDNSKYYSYLRLYWDEDWTAKPYFSIGAGTNYLQQWLDIGPNTWHTARLIMNSSHKVWAFFDGQYLGTVTYAGGVDDDYTANTMGIQCYSVAFPYTGTRYTYLDHARASTTKLEPDYCKLINIHGASINTRYYSEGDEGSLDSTNAADTIRYSMSNRPCGTATYALPVVPSGDSLTSKVLVQTTAGIRYLQKYPTSF